MTDSVVNLAWSKRASHSPPLSRMDQWMCPLYVAGLIGRGDRKSVLPMAERVVSGNYDQLHHS